MHDILNVLEINFKQLSFLICPLQCPLIPDLPGKPKHSNGKTNCQITILNRIKSFLKLQYVCTGNKDNDKMDEIKSLHKIL